MQKSWFHLVRQTGRWISCQGPTILGEHETVDAALKHLDKVAATARPAEVFVLHGDGSVRSATVIG
jgi:hypothetical protein